MTRHRLEIFKLFGFSICLDPSWGILLLLITYSLATGYFPQNYLGLPKTVYWSMGFIAAIGVFASILFHEMSHALMARHYKIKIQNITLFVFGGVAEMEQESPSPKAEFWVAILGPVFSGCFAVLLFVLSSWSRAWGIHQGLTLLLFYLGWMNALLALFNLLPAFPLDGGRVFRALLWALKKDYYWATRFAVRLGQILGWMLIAWGTYRVLSGSILAGLWMALIGFFLRRSSEMSLKQIVVQKRLVQFPLSMLLQTHFLKLHPGDHLVDMLGSLRHGVLYSHYPVLEGERLVGTVPLDRLKDIHEAGWESLKIDEFIDSNTDDLVCPIQENAWSAFQKMRSRQVNVLFIMEADRLVGLTSLEQLLRLAFPNPEDGQ